MTIDENTRLDLRQWFEANMGERLARAAMEAMPPIDYDQLATKADVDILGRELRSEMGELRSELRMEIASAVRLLVTMQVMTFGATIAAIVGLAAFLAG